MSRSREEIVRFARTWIGTPYVHQASQRGVGCDCLGLVRGIWRTVHGDEPEQAPAYAPDWGETGGGELLLEAARRHLVVVERGLIEPGDVLIFRFKTYAAAKHAAILATATTMIYAAEGAPVAEVPFLPWWRRRLVEAFAFPPAG